MSSCMRLLVLCSSIMYTGCPSPNAPNLPERVDAGGGGGGGVVACTETNQCAADQICIDGACEVPFTGCRTDRDCDEGALCFDGTCIRDCSEGGASCPAGMSCVREGRDGLCLITCRTDRDCPERTECVEVARDQRVCVPMEDGGISCGNDGACPRGFVCDEETNRCIDEEIIIEGCREDRDCADDQRCIDDMCREVDGRCRSDRDCGENAECIDNWCVSQGDDPDVCEDNRDCPDGMICHDEFFRCLRDPDEGCESNRDCDDEFVCIAGMCRLEDFAPCGEGFQSCDPDWMVCDDQLGVCLPPSCANGQRCPDGLTCRDDIFCLPGGGPAERCEDNRDCEDGQVCRRGRCQEDNGGGGGDPEGRG